MRLLPGAKRRDLTRRALVRPSLYDYDVVWERILRSPQSRHLPIFQGAFVDWDNTARYRNSATVFSGATPEKFGRYMKRLIDKVAKERESERFIFINAWNEWSESAYLEPDERWGTGYLEALARAANPG